MRLIMFVLTALALATSVNAKDAKIGVISTNAILSQYEEYNASSRIFAAEAKDARTLIDALKQELEAEMRDYERQKNSGLSPVRSQELSDHIHGLQEALENKAKEYFEEPGGKLYERQKELILPIDEKIRLAIKEVAEELGYDIVIDNSMQVLAYVNENTVDLTLTDKVLEKLQGKK